MGGLERRKVYDVVITGQLADNDLSFAEHLTRRGLSCCVLRNYYAGNDFNFSDYYTAFKPENAILYKGELDFIKRARSGRLFFSFTGALLEGIGRFWPVRRFLRLPPIVNWTTGSDITELAAESSKTGEIYREYLRFVDLNWCVPYPHAIKNIIRLRIPRVVFMHYPYAQADFRVSVPAAAQSGRIRFLHASHLDWKVNDPGEHRNSSKGNDRFIRAFARAIKSGMQAHCNIVDRGPDRETAKTLVHELGVESAFTWMPPLNRTDFHSAIQECDVVVDQFDVGGLGGIAVEAMSAGKPVMIFIDENCSRVQYTELPPVLNCYTEDEIYQQVIRCSDARFLCQLAEKAKDWAYRHHCWEECLDQFLFYYTLLTGQKVVDYGWERNPYARPELG